MAEEIAPTQEGWERLKDSIELNEQGINRYPFHHVDVVVQYAGRHGSRTVEGTLLRVKSVSTYVNGGPERKVHGWFGKIRTSEGMVNIYADPNHGGPQIVFTDSWDGTGGKRYKWEIENVVIEEQPGTDPQCFACCSSMEFGYIDGWPDVPGTNSGWICRNCARGHGKIKNQSVEQGLP